MLLIHLLLEGILLGILLVLACASGIRGGAVGMVHLYHKDVQKRCVELGLTIEKNIRRRALLMKLCAVVYLAVLIPCVLVVNGARGFFEMFWQMTVILLIVNLIDRLFIDDFWVGHTKAWIIPGTEDMMPYISSRDKAFKWVGGIVCSPIAAAILAGIMTLFGF